MLEDLFVVCVIIDFQLFFSALRFYYIFQFPLCLLQLPLAPTLGPVPLEAVVPSCSSSLLLVERSLSLRFHQGHYVVTPRTLLFVFSL